MKKSEKMLMGATVLALVVFMGYRMGWHETIMEKSRTIYISESVLESEREKVQRIADVIAREDAVRAQYALTVRQQLMEPSPEKDPEAEFSEYVVDLCKELNVSLNTITPPSEMEIPDVDDYKYMTMKITFQMEWPQVVTMLKSFDKKYLLIKELLISAPLDRTLSVDLTLARVVPLTEEEQKAKKAARIKKSSASQG